MRLFVLLGLLRANAADLERRALSGEKQRIARMVTERSLRNRALAITHRLQGMDELQRHQFVAEAVRRLYQDSARPATRRCGRSAWRAPPPSISHDHVGRDNDNERDDDHRGARAEDRYPICAVPCRQRTPRMGHNPLRRRSSKDLSGAA